MLSMDEHRNPVKSVVMLRVEGGKYRFVERIAPEASRLPANPAR
jgi:hypothetical protein